MTTPMMKQYHEAKAACGDALLLFRMGDFYELFLEDAVIASKVLGLTLTSRDKDSENPTAMAGFPYHQLDTYLSRLIQAGYRAAVCEQVEDPKLAKGLVKREISRVVSAGTLTDDGLLNPREANYVAAIVHGQPIRGDGGEAVVGIAWAELSSGRFEAGVFPLARLDDELERIGPAEVLYREDDPKVKLDPAANWSWTRRPPWNFAVNSCQEALCKQFGTQGLEGFGFDETHTAAIQAAGAVLVYLQETQRGALDHFDSLIAHHRSASLLIDASTRRSLELTRTMRTGSREGSLLDCIDYTCTAMGSRLLADWLAAPLVEISSIEARHDAVDELSRNEKLRTEIRKTLNATFDLSRLIGRIATGRCGPRDLQQVCATLAMLPELKAKLTGRKSELLCLVESNLHLCPELRSTLESALADPCPLSASDGNFVRLGYDSALDQLRELAKGGKQ